MQVIVDKILTSYVEVGTGDQIILFLHGWADSAKTFNSLAKDVTANKQYKALLLDLPGFGGTEAPKGDWGLDQYASFVADFLKKTKYKTVAIIGHSNGGAIAIRGLASGALHTEKLVLIASAGIREKSTKKQLLQFASKSAKLALKAAPETTQKRLKRKFYGVIGSDYLIAEHMQETFKKIVATDVQADAKMLTLKTCILYGDQDTATPPSYGERFQTLIRGSDLHIVPMTGHFVHQEQVYKVSTAIKEFLA